MALAGNAIDASAATPMLGAIEPARLVFVAPPEGDAPCVAPDGGAFVAA